VFNPRLQEGGGGEGGERKRKTLSSTREGGKKEKEGFSFSGSSLLLGRGERGGKESDAQGNRQVVSKKKKNFDNDVFRPYLGGRRRGGGEEPSWKISARHPRKLEREGEKRRAHRLNAQTPCVSPGDGKGEEKFLQLTTGGKNGREEKKKGKESRPSSRTPSLGEKQKRRGKRGKKKSQRFLYIVI